MSNSAASIFKAQNIIIASQYIRNPRKKYSNTTFSKKVMQQSNCNIPLCNYHALVSDVLFFKEIHFNSIKRCTELTKVVFQQSLVDCKQVGITAGSELVMPEQCQWPLIRILYENFCCCCWCPYLQQSCENFCIHLDRWMILVKKENVKKTHTSKIKKNHHLF